MASLRILLVTPDLFGSPGGIARNTQHLCKALSESPAIARLDVVVLHDSIEQAPLDRYLHGNKVHYLPCGGSKRRFIQRIYAVARHKHTLYLMGHVNFVPLVAPLHWLRPRTTALVAYAYGIDVWSRLPPLRRLPLQQVAGVIAISNYTKHRLAAANSISPDKVAVVHCCLDPYLDLPPLPSQRAGQHRPTLLTVSRLSPYDHYKGHATIIRALPKVLKHVPAVRYQVVGDGALRHELEVLATTLRVAQAVEWLGTVDDATLRRCYAECDLFVMPSRNEGFGLVFLVAMAQSKAIVAGNQDATVEVVVHGETGLLVDPDDEQALADAIIALLSDDARRREMGNAALLRVHEHFSFERFKRDLLDTLTGHTPHKQARQ